IVHQLYPHIEEFKFRTQAHAQSLQRIREEQQKRLNALNVQLSTYASEKKELINKLDMLRERMQISYQMATDYMEQAVIAAEPMTSGETVMMEKLAGWAAKCNTMRNSLEDLERQLNTESILLHG